MQPESNNLHLPLGHDLNVWGREDRSNKARPAAEAIHEVLGRGVGPADLAHRLAIVIEDAGIFRWRSSNIDSIAAMLEQTAKHLRAEAASRRERDAAK